VKSVAIEVSDTPVLVVGNGGRFAGGSFALINEGPDQVFLGGASVDDVDGFPYTTDDDSYGQDFPSGSNEKLYAICSSGNSATLRVIRTGS
jgi:hypothetical protein